MLHETSIKALNNFVDFISIQSLILLLTYFVQNNTKPKILSVHHLI